jgi:hypothetical protein
MGVGFLQISVRSSQDNYLIGNPQFSFFKAVYRRHTNFALEPYLLPLQGDTSNPWGKKFNLKIPKNGDLLYRMYLQFTLTGIGNNAPYMFDDFPISAFALINYIDMYIGDQFIDRQYGEWMHIFGETYTPPGKNKLLSQMIKIERQSNSKNQVVYVPLFFWFCRNAGLALPLLALSFSDIRFEINFNTQNVALNKVLVGKETIEITQVQAVTEYVHLDSEEKKLFASANHDYLIEQVQYNIANSVPLQLGGVQGLLSNKEYERKVFTFDLRFNHPVKEIFWVLQDSNNSEEDKFPKGNNLFNFWRNYTTYRDQILNATLCLNGKDIWEYETGNFYRSLEGYINHEGSGYELYDGIIPYYTPDGSGIYKYSFALYPQRHQPSGTLNFSGLDKAQLKIRVFRDEDNFWVNPINNQVNPNNISAKMLKVYATNYNILRIASGQGGLLFSN